MPELTVEIKGLAELAAQLKRLPVKIARKALKRGVSAGASTVRKAAKAFAPLGKTGTLKRAAIIKFVRSQSNDTQVVYIVTFRQGKKEQAKTRDAYYASWVERGHRIIPRRGKGGLTITARRRAAGTSGRRVRPHPFLEPAFQLSSGAAIDVMKAKITADLEKLPEFRK